MLRVFWRNVINPINPRLTRSLVVHHHPLSIPLKPTSLARHTIPLFFFNDTATTEIYTLSLHDALPIWTALLLYRALEAPTQYADLGVGFRAWGFSSNLTLNPGILPGASTNRSASWVRFEENRSEEHTSELQSPDHLVCRLLLEKKNYTLKAERRHTYHQICLIASDRFVRPHRYRYAVKRF